MFLCSHNTCNATQHRRATLSHTMDQSTAQPTKGVRRSMSRRDCATTEPEPGQPERSPSIFTRTVETTSTAVATDNVGAGGSAAPSGPAARNARSAHSSDDLDPPDFQSAPGEGRGDSGGVVSPDGHRDQAPSLAAPSGQLVRDTPGGAAIVVNLARSLSHPEPRTPLRSRDSHGPIRLAHVSSDVTP